MTISTTQLLNISIVEDDLQLSITELSHASRAQVEHIVEWVSEGILTPSGQKPEEWLFTGSSLQRAKRALTLTRDLEINTPGVALALDLLDEIARLQRR